MGTLSARTLREALSKAKNVGIVEERFPLFGDLELVVRNLRPDEYEAINNECKELEGLDYLYAFQLGHVKRAIVEMNGQDFRDVQFIEDEEEDPKKPGTVKPVKLELAHWLTKNVLSTWGKEAIYVVFRKVEDAVGRAENKAKEGIQFITPDETDEDKFRRLVGELKDLEGELPAKIVDSVLDDNGFMRKATADEVKRAMEMADQIAREEQARNAPPAPQASPPQSVPQPPPVVRAPPMPPPEAPPAQAQAAAGVNMEELMRNRQPMNQAAVEVPQPVIISPAVNRQPSPATRHPQNGPPPPEQVHAPLQGGVQGPLPHGSAAIRSAKHAALEADADSVGALAAAGQPLPPRPDLVPVIEKRETPVDPKAAATIMDPKPRGGVNPHYRPPPRGA